MAYLRRYIFSTMAPALLALSQISCYSPPARFDTVEMAEQEDIPVPKHFELRHSYSPKAAVDLNFRSWIGEYAGEEPVGILVPWYITEMQKNHLWKLSSLEVTGAESKRLHFEKNDETSTVEISRGFDSKRGGLLTFVRVRVSPRGPEEFTVDEHLERQKLGFKQVSVKEKESDGAEPYGITMGIEPGELGSNTSDESQPEELSTGKVQGSSDLKPPAVSAQSRAAKARKPGPPLTPSKGAGAGKGSSAVSEIKNFEEASR